MQRAFPPDLCWQKQPQSEGKNRRSERFNTVIWKINKTERSTSAGSS